MDDDGRQVTTIAHHEPCAGELKIVVCFSKPTPIFSDVEMKVAGNGIVRFVKICPLLGSFSI